MNRTRRPGPDTARWTLLWLMVTAAAVLAARSPQWTSALTTATAVYAAAGPDHGRRP
ncbi:hypothetical protein NC658_32455 [Streptomyces griseoincarnatus]|uniref:Sensor histidine kinase n=1 Tax=Streptomyces griseoincarnatus TaxID=29305 RepID=A0ABT0W2U9_STRGI|nr:hypothetical protein [Streptomyces griseoincarnatus]MCM2517906.1 hypothetical protein [Streptomyces griseoincarnatus]